MFSIQIQNESKPNPNRQQKPASFDHEKEKDEEKQITNENTQKKKTKLAKCHEQMRKCCTSSQLHSISCRFCACAFFFFFWEGRSFLLDCGRKSARHLERLDCIDPICRCPSPIRVDKARERGHKWIHAKFGHCECTFSLMHRISPIQSLSDHRSVNHADDPMDKENNIDGESQSECHGDNDRSNNDVDEIPHEIAHALASLSHHDMAQSDEEEIENQRHDRIAALSHWGCDPRILAIIQRRVEK